MKTMITLGDMADKGMTMRTSPAAAATEAGGYPSLG
jgi:hypothetical protein